MDYCLPVVSEGQSWCCSSGCGECQPVEVEWEYSRTEDKFGNLIDRKTELIWVSSCCKEELLLWDEASKDFIDWEAESIAEKEQP